ncbi:lipopolysaccharide transport system permease protein [Pedobacter sp. UYP24]
MINKEWKIDSKASYKRLRLKNVLSYRYLLKQLIYRDFIASYQQTILGPAWFIIHPIITTAVFTFVFGNIIKIHTDGIPKPLFYFTGLAIWTYFSECTIRISSVFKDNIETFGKVYFPRILVPLAITISMSLRLLIQLLLISVLLIFINFISKDPTHRWSIFLLLPAFVIATFQGMGIGLIMASMTIKYRDLNFMITFGLQLMMYATTLVFPLSAVPKNLQTFVQINPMTMAIETFRFALLKNGNFNAISLLFSIALSALLFVVGLVAFNRAERTFIDKI